MRNAPPIIPTHDLALAHEAVDTLVARLVEEPTTPADTLWIRCMNLVEQLPPEQQRQNLALLLTVALQRLAQHAT